MTVRRVALPLLFGGILLAGALANCGGDGEPETRAELAGSEVQWHSREDVVCVEPAAAVDAEGRTWVAWLSFRGARAAPRLVAGPLNGPHVAAGEELPGLAAPTLVALGPGRAYLVFEAQPDGAPALFGRTLELVPGNVSLGPLEEIAPAFALLPDAVATGDGALELVYQTLDASYDLAWRRRTADGTWSEVVTISDGPEDDWCPRVASAGDGTLHVVHDAWTGTSFDVRYLALEDGVVRHALDVATGPTYQGMPDVAVDASGRAWIAWEEAAQFGETGGLRAERELRIAAVEDGRVRHVPRADLPVGRADLPRVAIGDGGLLVTARAPGDQWPPKGEDEWHGFYSSWFTRAFAFGDRTVEVTLPDTDGDNDTTEVLLPGSDGVRVLFSADLRTRRRPKPGAFQEPTEHLWRVGSVLVQASGFPPLAAAAPTTERRGPARPVSSRASTAPFLGDLHRHTHLSRCQGAKDGTRLDAYRYARGPGDLDFVAITDHYQHLTPWSWWRSLRDVERFHAPGSLVTFIGIERALRTRAHVNEVYLESAEVPRDIGAFHREPDQPGTLPPEHALAIPHMMGMESAPFPWEEFDSDFHRLVEVYQGLRGSYEGPGLPYEASDRSVDASAVGVGLASGEHFGLIASSDHRASSTAFAGVRAEELTRASIFAALRARATFGSTAPCEARAELGPLAMGERGRVQAAEPLMVHARPAPDASIATVEVVKNGEPFARRGGTTGRELVVVSLRGYRPGPTRITVKGGELLGHRFRQRGESGASVESAGDSAVRVDKGVPFVDLVLELRREDELQLSLAREGVLVRIDLDDVAPGRSVRELEGFPFATVWRIGDPIGSRPGAEVSLSFLDPDRAVGDVYYARIAFTDGNLAWTSPIRVDALVE